MSFEFRVSSFEYEDILGGRGRLVFNAKLETRNSKLGFTLVEMVLSLALTSIVLLAITSSIMLASRALPGPRQAQAFTATLASSAALDRLTEEARLALHFSELSARAATFSIPDRDGDGYPERVRYHWSGTAGDPLLRRYNGGADAAVLPAVTALAFSTDTQAEALTYTGADVKSGEVTLNVYYSASGQNDERVEYGKWYAQYFRPADGGLPSGALRWQPTRAWLGMRYRSSTDGTLKVALHAADSNRRPTGAALSSVSISESLLTGSFAWVEAAFPSPPVMQPGEALSMVFSQTGGSNEAGDLLDANSASSIPGYHESNNSGSSWDYQSGRTLLHFVNGHYWTAGVTRTLTRQRHQRFAADVTLADDPAGPRRTAVNLVNRPYVADRYWRLSFDEPNPTLTDSNGDGAADWAVRTGTFDATDVAGGAWSCDQRIDSKPDDNFTAPTTVELRMKSTVAGQVGAAFWINADWGAASSNAGIYGRLTGGTTQTFSLYMETPGADALLRQVTGLPPGWVDVLLVVDPVNDEAALFVNGVSHGAFPFTFENDAADTPNVTLEEIQSGAMFDHVEVVVGGGY